MHRPDARRRVHRRVHRRWSALAGGLLLLAACGHTEPIAPGGHGTDRPPGDGAPARLTLARAADRHPAWAPDGAGILYSFERDDQADRDRCLGELPPAGGRIFWRLCDRDVYARDSLDVYAEPALALDGRIAYVRSRADTHTALHTTRVLALLDRTDPAAAEQALIRFEAAPTAERPYTGASHLRWLGTGRLLFRGDLVTFGGCHGCAFEPEATGIVALTLDVDGDRTPRPVPGTEQVAALAAAGADTIYYAVAGSSAVQRRLLGTGAVAVVHDFGPGRAITELDVAGTRLVAVIDSTLQLVDLATGTETPVAAGELRVLRAALAPAGDRVVVEANRGGIDLWLVTLP